MMTFVTIALPTFCTVTLYSTEAMAVEGVMTDEGPTIERLTSGGDEPYSSAPMSQIATGRGKPR